MDVLCHHSTGTLLVRQKRYINATLSHFNMININPFTTPGDRLLTPAGAILDTKLTKQYEELVGSLIYLVIISRPDISYAVMQISRLKGTQDLPLRYESEKAKGTGFADASYASESSISRSISGCVFFVSGAAISWSSKMQPIVAFLMTEAEYIALAYTAQEAIYLRNSSRSSDFRGTRLSLSMMITWGHRILQVTSLTPRRPEYAFTFYGISCWTTRSFLGMCPL
ncbi:unnamed protein product [Discosporangium mesarthrocarpum]